MDIKSNPKKIFNNSYVKYSSFAFQMIVVFVGLSLGGNWLDEYLELKFPVFTLTGVFFAIVMMFYSLYKLIRQKDTENE